MYIRTQTDKYANIFSVFSWNKVVDQIEMEGEDDSRDGTKMFLVGSAQH